MSHDKYDVNFVSQTNPHSVVWIETIAHFDFLFN